MVGDGSTSNNTNNDLSPQIIKAQGKTTTFKLYLVYCGEQDLSVIPYHTPFIWKSYKKKKKKKKKVWHTMGIVWSNF